MSQAARSIGALGTQVMVTLIAIASVALPAEGQSYTFTHLAGSLHGAAGKVDGTGSAARFNYPGGLAVDGSGTVYVADTQNDTIRVVTPGGVVTTLAGQAGVAGSADGTGTGAQFDQPGGVAVDGAGNVYVADSTNQTIRKVTPGGVVTTLAGQAGVSGSADGTGSAAQFNYPGGVAVDGWGNVYVADTQNSTIRKITPGGVVTTLAGKAGVHGVANGTGSAARFWGPVGVAVDDAGNVFVADTFNNTIRKVTPGGVVTTLAGLAPNSGSTDGTGSAARFNNPDGVAVDASANVYVADTWNHTIRKITPGGVVTTIAGLAGSIGDADGTGSAALFDFPGGVAVDAAGSVYVADTDNHAIRKGIPSTFVACVSDAYTACLVGGRYRVTSHWQDQYAGEQLSTLSAAPLTDATAAFWVSDSSSLEYLVRISTGTPNGHAWISIPTFTDVEFWIEVTDTTSGEYFEYHSPAGNRTLIYDPSFFLYPLRAVEPVRDSMTSPGSGDIRTAAGTTPETAGSCTQDATTMCLVGGRYKVTSTWKNQYAGGTISTLNRTTLTDATGAFWLTDSASFEYLIRITTGTPNGHAWIAIPTFTDVEFWITVQDTVNGQSFTYHSPAGNRTLIYDPSYFVYP